MVVVLVFKSLSRTLYEVGNIKRCTDCSIKRLKYEKRAKPNEVDSAREMLMGKHSLDHSYKQRSRDTFGPFGNNEC